MRAGFVVKRALVYFLTSVLYVVLVLELTLSRFFREQVGLKDTAAAAVGSGSKDTLEY